jgi:hypothetical protein
MRIFLEIISRRHGKTDEEIELLIGGLKWADGSPLIPRCGKIGWWPCKLRAWVAMRLSMGSSELQANPCFRQTLAGDAVKYRQPQEDEQCQLWCR